MNKTQILFGLAVIAFCCVTFSESIRCFYCNNKKSCTKPQSIECTARDANNTRDYLVLYHKNVPLNTTSSYLECFREVIKTKNDEFHYKGCTYQNIAGCSLQLQDAITQGQHSRNCYQCNNKNGCNPAGRADINLSTVFAPTIIVALIAKYVWSN